MVVVQYRDPMITCTQCLCRLATQLVPLLLQHRPTPPLLVLPTTSPHLATCPQALLHLDRGIPLLAVISVEDLQHTGDTVERGTVDMDVGAEDSGDGTCRYSVQYC